MPTQLDQDAVNLAKAIRQTESGGNFNAHGKSGEFGAYQFTPDTWNRYAPQYGVNKPLPQATPEDQNKVAYSKIKEWKDQGKNIGQIASMWNAGENKPDAYLDPNFRGRNKHGATFDVPAYAKSVATAYHTLKQGGQVNEDPNNPSSVGTQYPQLPDAGTNQPNESPSVGGFLGNVVSSGANFLGGIGQAVMHPIQTAENLGKVAIGGVEKLIPGQQGQEQNFDQLAQFYKERYGGVGNIAHTLYTDPVGAAADASVLLGGGGALLRGGASLGADLAVRAGGTLSDISKIGEVSKIGSTLSNAGEIINPLNLAGKAVSGVAGLAGKGIAEGLGKTTGVGAGPIREAFANPQDVVGTMRGGESAESVMNSVKEGVGSIKETRGANYRANLSKLPGDSYDISPLTNSLEAKLQQYKIKMTPNGELDFSRSPVSSAGQGDIQEAINIIKGWGSKAGDRTPEGLHILEQKLGDLIPKTGQARAFVTSLKSTLKDTLNNIPGYKEMQAGYAKDSAFINDINHSLLSNNPETAINKITSLMRRNKPFKVQIAKQLEEATGQKILGKVAGLELHDWQPRGLIGHSLQIAEGVGGFIHPAAFMGLLASSPRLAGEIIRYLGIGKLGANKILNALQKAKVPQGALVGQRINASQAQSQSIAK